MSKNYKPYYRTTKQKRKEQRQTMLFSISLLIMFLMAFVGIAFVLVKVMLYMTGFFL